MKTVLTALGMIAAIAGAMIFIVFTVFTVFLCIKKIAERNSITTIDKNGDIVLKEQYRDKEGGEE